MHIKVAVFVKIMLFQEKVIQRGSKILMKFGIYNDISPKDTYLKYFCVQFKVPMENTIFKGTRTNPLKISPLSKLFSMFKKEFLRQKSYTIS